MSAGGAHQSGRRAGHRGALMAAAERPNLYVEGPDDVHVVHHLLFRHGFDCPVGGDRRPHHEFAENVPEITWSGDRDAVLAAIGPAVRVSNDRSVGFVLDADENPGGRWHAVCGQLGEFGLALPGEIPNEGFVTDIPGSRARVGVWLMPDNQRTGALEDFLQDLVEGDDPLLPLARTSTAEATERGATFREVDRRKAVLHTWLAWQEVPGLPYGAAVKAQYFRVDSPSAVAFVDWYKRVFPGD